MAPGGAYVRCTIFDVRFGEFPRGARVWWSGCGGGNVERRAGVVRKRRWRLAAPMYDVRRTIWRVPARSARVWRSKCGVVRKRRGRFCSYSLNIPHRLRICNTYVKPLFEIFCHSFSIVYRKRLSASSGQNRFLCYFLYNYNQCIIYNQIRIANTYPPRSAAVTKISIRLLPLRTKNYSILP